MPAKNPPLKPGNKAPNSGQYKEVGPRGGQVNKEVTGVKGKVLPPTSKPGNGYILADPTNNGSGKKK
ncbi:YjzC family protein [Nocardia asteroides]